MVGIVGGGISGLAVAHHLRELGQAVVLLEAEAEVGGVMRTEWSVGLPLDTGPQRTRLTGEVERLVATAGLKDEVIRAPEHDLPLYVYRRGRLREVPFSIGAAVRTDLLTTPEKLRLLLEPLIPGPRREESVERFLTRSFGEGAYRALLGPLYGGLYASDPAQMRVRHGLSLTLQHFGVRGSLLVALARRGSKARAALPTVSFTEGMQMLPEGLARSLGDAVRTGSNVTGIRRSAGGGTSAGGHRFELEVEGAHRLGVEAVVLAVPSQAAAGILRGLAPDAAARIGRLHENRLATVHLRATRPADGRDSVPLEGLGYQVAFGEGLETRGVTWNGAMFGRGTLCAAYLGGMRNPAVVAWPDDRISRIAADEFRTVTGWNAEVLRVSRTRIPAWDESWDALDGLELPEGVYVCANWNGRPGIPGRAAAAKRVAADVVARPRGPAARPSA